MKLVIFWIFWLFILVILEISLVQRFIRYYKEIDLSRQVAVIILMFVTALVIAGIANLALLLIKFMVK